MLLGLGVGACMSRFHGVAGAPPSGGVGFPLGSSQKADPGFTRALAFVTGSGLSATRADQNDVVSIVLSLGRSRMNFPRPEASHSPVRTAFVVQIYVLCYVMWLNAFQ